MTGNDGKGVSALFPRTQDTYYLKEKSNGKVFSVKTKIIKSPTEKTVKDED